jgi:hypothetical protein
VLTVLLVLRDPQAYRVNKDLKALPVLQDHRGLPVPQGLTE